MRDIEFAGKVVEGLLVKFCDIPAEEYRERWKPVRSAAGVIVGRALAEDHSWPAEDVPQRAQELTQGVINELHARIVTTGGSPDLVATIAKGLNKRVAETLVAMGC
jgi:hypothetical protein